jgi:hypothetical protein
MRSIVVALAVASLAVLAACARPSAERAASASAGDAAASKPTVFTDTALFSLHCAEADSGIRMSAGRCTPRDQRVLLRPLPPR